MKELFLQNFSSVHVHYVPLAGFKRLGTSETILKQTSLRRIRNDSTVFRKHELKPGLDLTQYSCQ